MTSEANRWVVVPVAHQLDGTPVDVVLSRRNDGAARPERQAGGPKVRVELFRGVDAELDVNAEFYRRGWTDGLPIIAPTLGRVEAMQRYSDLSAAASLTPMEPMMGVPTAEKLAANAVMAGCRPEYFPVVLAAVRCMLDPSFNMRGVQTTDENVAPLLIVSGPLAEQLDVNAGLGALGPGHQANASIGRALRLIMMNIGGGWPGVVSLAGIGQPARYTLCLAERAQAGWPQLNVEAGFDANTSTVTIMRAESVINVTGGLDDLASTMSSAVSAMGMLHGGQVAVLLAPHTAAKLAGDGWSKRAVAQYLFDHSTIPTAQWQRYWIAKDIAPTYGKPEWIRRAEVAGAVPVVEDPAHIAIFVAGGDAPIAQHVYFPTWGFPACRVTRQILTPPRAAH